MRPRVGSDLQECPLTDVGDNEEVPLTSVAGRPNAMSLGPRRGGIPKRVYGRKAGSLSVLRSFGDIPQTRVPGVKLVGSTEFVELTRR